MKDMPLVDLRDVSVSFPVRKHSLGLSNNLLNRTTIGGIVNRANSGSVSVQGLKDVNVQITRGESVGFVGVNGAGKSTILKVIAGVLPVTSGTVLTAGRVTSLLNIGLGVDAEMSGYENLELRMIYEKIPRKERERYIRDVMEFSELGDFFYLPFKTYSSGMRARLLLALSTLRKPDVLIMDEWIGAGDVGFKSKADERLKSFISTSGALVLATHSKSLLEKWTQRGIWLDKGLVRADGPITEVLDEYIKFVNDRNSV